VEWKRCSKSEAEHSRRDESMLVCAGDALARNWRCRWFAGRNAAQGIIVVGRGAAPSVIAIRVW
jgi:hypothetical protein